MKTLLLAIAAGAASALLYLAVTAGNLMAIPLFYVAALPVLLVGMGWGTASGWIAAIAGAAVAAITATNVTGASTGLVIGLIYAGACGLPTAYLARLVMLGRHVAEDDPGSPLEWYPFGWVLIWCAGFGTAITLAFIAYLNFDLAVIATMFEQIMSMSMRGDVRAPALPEGIDLPRIAVTLANLVPKSAATLWTIAAALNVWLALRILAGSGRVERLALTASDFRLPITAAFPLALALPAKFAGGALGIVGDVVFASFATIFALTGIAFIHEITRGKPFKPVVLVGLYMSLIFAPLWAILPLAMLGLADSHFNLRKPANGASQT